MLRFISCVPKSTCSFFRRHLCLVHPRNHFSHHNFRLARDPVSLCSVLVQITIADGCCSNLEKSSPSSSSVFPFRFELVDSCCLRALIDFSALFFASAAGSARRPDLSHAKSFSAPLDFPARVLGLGVAVRKQEFLRVEVRSWQIRVSWALGPIFCHARQACPSALGVARLAAEFILMPREQAMPEFSRLNICRPLRSLLDPFISSVAR
jgi:hypothetical protein